MSRRRKIILLIGGSLLLLALIVFLVFRPEPEPTYKGRKLSEWVVSNAAYDDVASATALREIGAPAVPYLLKWLRYEESPNRKAFLARINQPIRWLQAKLKPKADWTIQGVDPRRAWAAARAFAQVAPHANYTVTELTQRMNNTNQNASWVSLNNAACALASLGESGRSPLLAAIKGTNQVIRRIALANTFYLGTNALPVIPLLLQILEDDNGQESRTAASVLGHLKLAPEIVVPALIKSLASTNSSTCISSGSALANFGPLARPVIPALTDWLSGGDRAKQKAAANFLPFIDPKSFTNPPPTRRNP